MRIGIYKIVKRNPNVQGIEICLNINFFLFWGFLWQMKKKLIIIKNEA
jgi:hypothetical protein